MSGVIADIVIGFGVTVKLPEGAEVPTGVVMEIVLRPRDACGSMVMVIGRLVAVPPLPMVAATPPPLNVTEDAPDKPDPVIVTPRVVPCAPLPGESAEIEAKGVTLNPLNADEVPVGVVTVTACTPREAPDATETVTGRVVGVPPVLIVAVTPVPSNFTALAP